MSIAGIVTQLGTPQDIVTRGLIAGEAVAEVAETFSGGYFDYDAHRPKFKPKTKEEKKAAPIIEQIAENIIATELVETKREIELVLRLRLRQEGLIYKNLYLSWIIRQDKIRKAAIRRREEELIILMLH